MKKINIILLGLILCGTGFFLNNTLATNQSDEDGLDPQTKLAFRPVPTATVVPLTKTKVRVFPGVVQARSRVELTFTVDGLLQELNASEGQLVQKGEVLGRVDQRNFQLNYDAAKANYKKVESELKRATILKERGIVPVLYCTIFRMNEKSLPASSQEI